MAGKIIKWGLIALGALFIIGAVSNIATGNSSPESSSVAEATDPADLTPEPTVETTPEPTVEPTPDPTPDPTPVPTPVSTTYGVGETVNVTSNGQASFDVVVSEAAEAVSYADPDGYFPDEPEIAGNVFIAAKITYTAIENNVSYNPFDWQVFVDGQAVDNYAFVMNGPQPELGSGTLPAGRTAEGWVVYEVPAQGEVLLSYGSNMFSNDAPIFEVVLRAG